MKFVFFDKNDLEADIIKEILSQEGIPHITRERTIAFLMSEEDEDEVNDYFVTKSYDIEVRTDLEHFDFIKKLSDKKIAQRKMLERCFSKKSRKRKDNV